MIDVWKKIYFGSEVDCGPFAELTIDSIGHNAILLGQENISNRRFVVYYSEVDSLISALQELKGELTVEGRYR